MAGYQMSKETWGCVVQRNVEAQQARFGWPKRARSFEMFLGGLWNESQSCKTTSHPTLYTESKIEAKENVEAE